MSSSAFTPSTTTVTNNVPVNVPVVTAWEAYTPTFEGFGTPTSVSVLWRRVGDNIQVTGNFTSGTPTSATATISLPSGLNLDSTKINGPGQTKILGFVMRANSTSTPFPANTRGPFVITESKNSSTSKVYLSFIANTLAGGAFEVAAGTNILTSGELLTFEFNAPISQWSGSGTTTLATRAVEEYAWNSNTADGNDTTSFAYGPSGVVFGSYTANRQKTVRFQSAILPTDSLAIEILIPGSTIWQPIQTVNNYASIFVEAGATNYGMRFEPLNSTDVTIIFGAWRKPSSGTYAAAGAPWSEITTTRWRLRKVSGGAAVGYPISARNIVGDTSGSVVPVGMLGETYRVSVSGSAPNLTTVNLATVALPAGVWSVTFCGYFNVNNAILHQQVVSISLTSASNDGNFQSILQGNTTTAEKQVSLTRIVNTTGQNLFLTWYQNGSASTSISGYIVYTRIA